MTIPRRMIFSFLLFICSLAGVSCQPAPLEKRESPFQYYGWIYLSYTAANNDLERLSAYTNTGFAVVPQQVALLENYGFKNIIYLFNESAILEAVWKNEGRNAPQAKDGILWYEQEIPDFRVKFFAAYREYLLALRDELLSANVYPSIDIFYLADEPALHKNVYLDQAFLDDYAAVFKQVFPDKLSAITFAQAGWEAPGAGTHYAPPEQLDIIIVDPYFVATELGLDEVPCQRDAIRAWLYRGNPISSIEWAQQFHKPILVAGDAQLKNNQPPKACYLQEMIPILQADPDIAGLIWFIYDRDYSEGWGYIRGGANNPALLRLIEGLEY